MNDDQNQDEFFNQLRDALDNPELQELLDAYLGERTAISIAQKAVSQFKDKPGETPKD